MFFTSLIQQLPRWTEIKISAARIKSTEAVKVNESCDNSLAIYNKMHIRSNASFSPEIPHRPLNSFANAQPGSIPPIAWISLKSRPHTGCKNANAE
jgi:hypothetical protein